MYCYKYNPTTFEYIETRKAHLDPEETKAQGTEVYALPINATFKKPPQLIKFKTAVYNKEKDIWKTVDDFRGEYIVNSSMNVQIMHVIGALPDGYINITKEQANIIINDPVYFIIEDGQLIENPDYEEIKRQQEAEKIANLSMTKYDFYKHVCQPHDIDYQQIKTILASNDEIAAAWEFCERICRNDELLNKHLKDFIPDITDAELDEIFKQFGK